MHGVSSSIVATVWQLNCYDRRSRAFVRREVVHYHHLSGLERRHQDFLQISLEDLPRGRAFDRQAWTHPSRAHARQERHVRPPVARQRTKGSLSSSRPSVEGCQRGVGGALVYEHQPLGVDLPGDHHSPCRPQEFVSLARTQRSFFRVHPMRFRTLDTVESLTSTPPIRRKNARLCGKVAAGRSRRSASKSLLAPSSSLGLEPGRFFGASDLPWRAVAT